MPHLITCLGHDKERWHVIERIISSQLFDIIYIVTDIFGKDNFIINPPSSVTISYILVDFSDSVEKINEELSAALKRAFGKDKIVDLEIAINITSGDGRLHSALISAVMKLGYGLRIIEVDKDDDVAVL